MSASIEVYDGDIGTDFIVTLEDGGVAVDISGATTLEIKFQKPDGTTTLTETASLVGDGTDGKLHWVATTGKLTPAGRHWKLQAHIAWADGSTYHSSVEDFTVGNVAGAIPEGEG